ncbi:MFS transporter [Arthrobacter sp. HLT1-21]
MTTAQLETSTPTRRRPGRLATAMAALTTVVGVLPVFLIGGLAVQLEADLRMTPSALGVVVGVFWGVSALLSASAGVVATTLGLRRGMPLGVCLGLISLVGIAFLTPGWPWLILWLTFAGAANALCQPLSNGLIVDQVDTRNRAFAFGLKQAAIPAATLAAGLSVPLIALTIGWQWTFAIAAALAILFVPALVRSLPRRAPSDKCAPKDKRAPRPKAVRTRLPRELRPFLLMTAVASGLGSAQANVVGSFTVASAVGAGYNAATAGLLLAAASVAGILARPLVGIAADRGIGGSMATVAIMMGTGCVGLIGMASGHPVAYGIGSIIAFGLGWGWNGLVHFVVSRASHPHTTRATGITQIGTYLGATLGPLVFGFIFTHFPDGVGWSLAAVVAAAGAATALVAFQLEKRLQSTTAS